MYTHVKNLTQKKDTILYKKQPVVKSAKKNTSLGG